MVGALRHHDSGRRVPAIDECRSALDRDEDYQPARQLLAKLLTEQGATDSGRLGEAEREYQILLQKGYDRANVHVGLGVISLMRASVATDSKGASDLADKARRHFQDARSKDSGCPEAEIGLAHVKLLLAVHPALKQGGVSDARAEFEKIRTRLESTEAMRSKITREGVLDLYAGHGRACAEDGASKDAARSFRICTVYFPHWPVALANLAYADARRFSDSPPAPGDLERDPSVASFTSLLDTLLAVTRPEGDPLREAHANRELALAFAYGMADDTLGMNGRINRLGSDRREGLTVSGWVWIQIWQGKKDVTPKVRGDRAYYAAAPYKTLLGHAKFKDAPPAERAAALNVVGVLVAESAYYTSSAHVFPEAEKALLEASGLEKANFRFHRNLAVLRKMMASRESDPEKKKAALAQAQQSIEEARKAAGSDPAKLENLGRVEGWKP